MKKQQEYVARGEHFIWPFRRTADADAVAAAVACILSAHAAADAAAAAVCTQHTQ